MREIDVFCLIFCHSLGGVFAFGTCVRERGEGGGVRKGKRKISDSLIKDVSKTLIKIEYPCKCKATRNLQVFHLEMKVRSESISVRACVFMSFFIAHK